MKLTNLQSGMSIMLDEKFDIKNPNTWLNPLVKFFINIWNKFNKKPYVRSSHVGIVADHNGELWFWESVKDGFIPTKRIKDRFYKDENIIVLIPKFSYQRVEVDNICKNLNGTPYDYPGTIIQQLVYQITNEKLWLGDKKVDQSKKLYCVEGVCYIYNQMNRTHFPEWYKCDQKDLYFSDLFKKESLEF